MENNSKFVYIAAFTYSIIIGLSFLFGKIALAIVHPLDLLAYRFTASFIVVLLLLLFRIVKVNYNLKSIIRILPLALLYPLLFFGFQTFGLQNASSSEAGIVSASTPIFTLILASFFLKEKTNIFQKIAVFASVVGVIYITLMKGSAWEVHNLLGIILILLSALSFSGYSVVARKLTQDFSNIELSVIMIIISFVCFNVLALTRNLINGSFFSSFRKCSICDQCNLSRGPVHSLNLFNH
jgi:drug/metabolite transporter (DMT)-like permease